MRSSSLLPWCLVGLPLLSACGGVTASNVAPAPAPPVAGPQPGTGEFVAYREKVPGGDGSVGFDLVPIGGGTFTMGSPAAEAGRKDDEGPAVVVQVEPFWIGKHEVTWAEYDLWNTDIERPQSKKPDGVARPTPPYMDMTFNMGRDGYPAICMSHAAARQYCKWLSDKTGHFYRLPTEAEWEYACRAGTTTPWHTGAQPDSLLGFANLADVTLFRAWRKAPEGDFDDGFAAHAPVGSFGSNGFGLYDMHGNIAEPCAELDAALPNRRVLRGGCWLQNPDFARSAYRSSTGFDERNDHVGVRAARSLH